MFGIVGYLVGIGAAIGMSVACATFRSGGFSMNIFMVALSISIAVLVWIPLIPVYMIIVSIFLLVGLLFTGSDESE